ncbi:hypothetical protein MANES_16G025050v8 [Manihot esculenta]|uniref:Uncharacterized protein n=1 Tax=Manihot esculenta TaxID=3983 RepID=A0ACB7G510_MANES|nr:hypothetical protein MANES_16G025050v8 [Manihot esculenta]
MASRFLQNWTAAAAASFLATAAAPNSDHLRSWQRLSEGWMKVNVDASISPSLDFMGLGVVVRDSYGEFVAAKAWLYPGFFSAKNAEAISIVEVLSWIKSEAINSLCFAVRSSFGLIVSDCKSPLSEIVDTKCCFSYRSTNVIAHLLATGALSESGLGVWYVNSPPFIVTSLMQL